MNTTEEHTHRNAVDPVDRTRLWLADVVPCQSEMPAAWEKVDQLRLA